MQKDSFEEGYFDGVAGNIDYQRIDDRRYLDGAANGLLAFDMFIKSALDHHRMANPHRSSASIDPPPCAIYRFRWPKIVVRAAASGHIPWAMPDLSDQDGTTRHEELAIELREC